MDQNDVPDAVEIQSVMFPSVLGLHDMNYVVGPMQGGAGPTFVSGTTAPSALLCHRLLVPTFDTRFYMCRC